MYIDHWTRNVFTMQLNEIQKWKQMDIRLNAVQWCTLLVAFTQMVLLGVSEKKVDKMSKIIHYYMFTCTFVDLADAFIWSNLQLRNTTSESS